MVDTHERDSLPVTRPRREGQLVIVPTRARPDQNPEAAAVSSNRRQPPPRMWAPACPAEDDRAAVGRPRRVHAFGRPAAGAETAQVSSVGVDDPQAPAGATRNASAECNLTVTGAPADARTVGVDPTNAMEVRPVAVHHEQRADERLPNRLSDKGDPPSVARPGRSAAVARQLLEVAVWIASDYPAVLTAAIEPRGSVVCAASGDFQAAPTTAESATRPARPSWVFVAPATTASKTPDPQKMFAAASRKAAFRRITGFSASAGSPRLRAHQP